MGIFTRLTEPSSWAAIAAVLAVVGFNVPDAIWQQIVMAGTGVAGLLGLLLKEPGK